MGYLDNTTLTVDAILTKKGRQLLAEGTLEITKFALGDDEIDYRLWDANHSLGTNYYGEAIEKMPLLEAFTDENQMMRSKLLSLPKSTVKLPLVEAGVSAITLSRPGNKGTITPTTANTSAGNKELGYTCILSNSNIATLVVASGGKVQGAGSAFTAVGDDSANSVSVVGTKFDIIAKSVTTDSTTTITIVGNETGGTVTIPLTVKKDPEIAIVTSALQ